MTDVHISFYDGQHTNTTGTKAVNDINGTMVYNLGFYLLRRGQE